MTTFDAVSAEPTNLGTAKSDMAASERRHSESDAQRLCARRGQLSWVSTDTAVENKGAQLSGSVNVLAGLGSLGLGSRTALGLGQSPPENDVILGRQTELPRCRGRRGGRCGLMCLPLRPRAAAHGAMPGRGSNRGAASTRSGWACVGRRVCLLLSWRRLLALACARRKALATALLCGLAGCRMGSGA